MDNGLKKIKPLGRGLPGFFYFYCEGCKTEWNQREYAATTKCEYCKKQCPIEPGQKAPIQNENAA